VTARLAPELSGSQRAHYVKQQTVRSLEIELDQMRGFASQCVIRTAQLEERKERQARCKKMAGDTLHVGR
jgi:hypothetical protein